MLWNSLSFKERVVLFFFRKYNKIFDFGYLTDDPIDEGKMYRYMSLCKRCNIDIFHVSEMEDCSDSIIQEFLDNTDIFSTETSNPLVDFLGGFADILPNLEKEIWRFRKEYLIKLLEDVGTLIYFILNKPKKCPNWDFVVVSNFIRSRYGESVAVLMMKQWGRIAEFFFELQSDDEFDLGRNLLDKFSELKNSPFFLKLHKVIACVLAMTLYKDAGEKLDFTKLSSVVTTIAKLNISKTVDFAYCVLDIIVYLCTRGYQCYKQGSLDPIYNSGNKYEEWYDQASRFKVKANVLGNPEACGLSRFEIIGELNELIDKGNTIAKHATRLGVLERKMVKAVLNDLLAIKYSDLTKRNALSMRNAPMVVMLGGGSSIGKSTLIESLFTFYGKVRNLPVDDHYKYTTNSDDEFQSGFESYMWCYVADDVSYMHPNVATQGDPSLMNFIALANNVPHITNQAELQDKGRIPFKGEFLIGTTNTEHLNVDFYFSCPLAVLRRINFYIDVRPKPEYIKNNCFLDSSKLPPIIEGEFPDYWIYEVKVVKPIFDGGKSDYRVNQKATFETLFKFECWNELATWFGNEILKYNEVQNTVTHCSKSIKKAVICNKCFLTMCNCINIQSTDVVAHVVDYAADYISSKARYQVNSSIKTISTLSFKDKILLYIFILYISSSFVRFIITYIFCIKEDTLTRFLDKQQLLFKRKIMYSIGDRVERSYPICIYYAKLVSIITASSMVYMLCKKIFSKISIETQADERPIKDEVMKTNIWKKEDYAVTTFDVSRWSNSNKTLTDQQIMDTLSKNVVFVEIDYVVGGVKRHRRGCATCVCGQFYLLNNHTVPEVDVFDIKVLSSPDIKGININMTMNVSSTLSLKRFIDKDLAILWLKNMPPKKDIRDMFCNDTLRGNHKGFLFGRNLKGECDHRKVENINYEDINPLPIENFKGGVWHGYVNVPTILGNSGSLLIAHTHFGPSILGIHDGGGREHVYSAPVSKYILDNISTMFDTDIVLNGTPNLTLDNKEIKIIDVHNKSPVCWIESGKGNVLGSIEGHRSHGKSLVGPTFIRDSLLKRGYQVTADKPIMHGWEIWRNALLPIVGVETSIREDVLNEAHKSYIQPILNYFKNNKSKLNNVKVFDTFTAINGAEGVRFIDKLNRNTSMGFPYNKSKRFYIYDIEPQDNLSDPVDFTPEVNARIADCWSKWGEGIRYCPISNGSPKDEARSFKKIEEKNTRIFYSGNVECAVNTRRLCLGLIKLICENNELFETAIGINAHSLEWDKLHKYITKHGDLMIGSDFKYFDKKQMAILIIYGFDCLVKIAKLANYSKEDITRLRTCALDCAFSLVNFNGTLIEFISLNPSGGVLTTIINTFTNCHLHRYAYIINKMQFECSGLLDAGMDFRDRVALITYGDDAVNNVRPDTRWYNHTSIQKALLDIGIHYTMAQKDAESVDFISIDQIDFLKRSFTYDEELDSYVGKLDEQSIIKSLTVCVKSKSITPEQQSVVTLESAAREYFLYGRETYEQKVELFKQIIIENNLQNYMRNKSFLSYDELKQEYLSYNVVPQCQHIVDHIEQLGFQEIDLALNISIDDDESETSDEEELGSEFDYEENIVQETGIPIFDSNMYWSNLSFNLMRLLGQYDITFVSLPNSDFETVRTILREVSVLCNRGFRLEVYQPQNNTVSSHLTAMERTLDTFRYALECTYPLQLQSDSSYEPDLEDYHEMMIDLNQWRNRVMYRVLTYAIAHQILDSADFIYLEQPSARWFKFERWIVSKNIFNLTCYIVYSEYNPECEDMTVYSLIRIINLKQVDREFYLWCMFEHFINLCFEKISRCLSNHIIYHFCSLYFISKIALEIATYVNLYEFYVFSILLTFVCAAIAILRIIYGVLRWLDL